jgi:hypothetical protein
MALDNSIIYNNYLTDFSSISDGNADNILAYLERGFIQSLFMCRNSMHLQHNAPLILNTPCNLLWKWAY